MGSRWREMLMDYGQVLGDKSSKSSNSAFFTVDGDLDDKKNEELMLRRTLEVHFRPLFQRFVYGGEKIACHDLRRILRDPEYRNRLPPDKVHELSDMTDFNMGRTVRYDEFVRIVLGKRDDSSSSIGSQTGLNGGSGQMGGLTTGLRVFCRITTEQQQIDETLEKYKCMPPPFFMIAITLTQIIVFIIYSQVSDVTTYPLKGIPMTNETGNYAMYMPCRRREAWRFITYCFLHQGYIDLIFNVIIQLGLGISLEIMFSTWRIVIVYMLGVIVGSLSHSLMDHHAYLVGAGGGAYAIMFAHAVSMFLSLMHLTESKTKRILCNFTLRYVFILLVLIPQIALAVYRRWFYDPDANERVGITAHLAGLVAGFILGPAFFRDNKRYPWPNGSEWIILSLFMIYLGFCIIFNIAYEGYPVENYNWISTNCE